MKINTGRWVLAGGLLGGIMGGVIALAMLLGVISPADGAAGPRVVLPSQPRYGSGPPGAPTGDSSTDFDRALDTMREVIQPFMSAGKFQEAQQIVDLIGDAGTGREEFRDSVLLWIVQSLTTITGFEPAEDDLSVEDGETATAADVDRFFDMLDADDNGEISQAELEQHQAKGLLSKDEIAILRDKDADGDDQLSREEFNPKGREDDPAGDPLRYDAGTSSMGDVNPEEGVIAEEPIDYAKALEIAREIHHPLIRAEALSLIGRGQLGEKMPEAEATLGQAMEAVRAYRTELGAESRGSRTGDIVIRVAIPIVVSAFVMMFLFYILARGLVAFADLLSQGMAETLDHESMRRAGSAS